MNISCWCWNKHFLRFCWTWSIIILLIWNIDKGKIFDELKWIGWFQFALIFYFLYHFKFHALFPFSICLESHLLVSMLEFRCNAFSTSSSCVEGWFALILHYYCCEFLVINCDCALSDSCDLALNIFTLPWKQAQLFMHIYVFSLRFDSCNILIFSLYRTYSHDHHIQICVSLRWFLHKCSKKCTHH